MIAAVCLAGPLRAHDPGISTAQGRVRAGGFELTVGFAPADAQQLLPPDARTTGKWTQAEFESTRGPLGLLAPKLWELTVGGAAIAPREMHVQLAAGDSLSFSYSYPCPDAGMLRLRALKLGELPRGHREFLVITDEAGREITKKLLNAEDDTLEIPLARPDVAGGPADNREMPTVLGFLRLGVEHIWTGYDHMLFLFALLVVCRSFRSIVTIISCFTVAHSITLAVATLGLVNIPSRITEPAIAASIVFVGVENLIRRGAEPRGRWALTFAFGLIHGFGFASVLRELGVGGNGGSIAMPLVTFNLGVEIGQITIASIVLPVVWRLRKKPAFLALGVPALSAIVSVAGLYWFLERTIFA